MGRHIPGNPTEYIRSVHGTVVEETKPGLPRRPPSRATHLQGAQDGTDYTNKSVHTMSTSIHTHVETEPSVRSPRRMARTLGMKIRIGSSPSISSKQGVMEPCIVVSEVEPPLHHCRAFCFVQCTE